MSNSALSAPRHSWAPALLQASVGHGARNRQDTTAGNRAKSCGTQPVSRRPLRQLDRIRQQGQSLQALSSSTGQKAYSSSCCAARSAQRPAAKWVCFVEKLLQAHSQTHLNIHAQRRLLKASEALFASPAQDSSAEHLQVQYRSQQRHETKARASRAAASFKIFPSDIHGSAHHDSVSLVDKDAGLAFFIPTGDRTRRVKRA